MKKIWTALLILGLAACNNSTTSNDDGKSNPTNGPKSISGSIINTFPHDTSSFTEGLLIYKGNLYESTGLEGKSKLIQADLKTGKIIRSISLPEKYFGEGITIINDTVYQLTYRTKVAFMYSLKDFKKIGEFPIAAEEGWGMTTDGKQIIASDGTSNLYFYEPGTFKLLKTQAVTEAGSLSFNVNELEYIDGYIYANQWQQPYIYKIDPGNGQVVGKIDFSELVNRVKASYPFADVLNGIAYDAATKKIYITGKNWPELYEIQLGQ
jgi:glutamine cyclotransferase